MAHNTSSFLVILATWCALTSAEVLTFDSHMLGSVDPDTDLLLVLGEENHAGNNEVHNALQSLDEGKTGLKRTRGLVVSQCMGCASSGEILGKYNLKPGDLPVAFIFPYKSQETKLGIFLLRLKGVGQPLPAMSSFIESFDAEKLQPWIRSLPEPTEQEQQGPVRVIVGSTFEHEIVEAEKHNLLLIFSGRDKDAKPLLPILEEIGQKLAKIDPKTSPLQAGKFDSDANDFPPSFNPPIDHIPQLTLFRKGDPGDPDVFPEHLPQTEEGVIDWLREMLPDRNYGLDNFLSSMANGAKAPLDNQKQRLVHWGAKHHTQLEEI